MPTFTEVPMDFVPPVKEEVPAAEAQVETPAVPATPEAQPAIPNTPPPAETPPVEVAPPALPAVPAPTEYDPWEKLGVKENKALAEKAIAAINAGEWDKFTQTFSVNPDKLGGEDFIRMGLRKEYPEADTETIEYLLREELENKYSQGEYDEMKIKAGKYKLDAFTTAQRAALKAEQEAYQPPAPVDHQAAWETQQKAQLEQYQKQQAEVVGRITNSQVFKDFETNRKITFGTGDDAITIEAGNVGDASDWLNDSSTFYNDLWVKDDKGQVKLENGQPVFNDQLYLTMKFLSKNPTAAATIAKLYKEKGALSEFEQNGTSQRGPSGVTPPAPSTGPRWKG